MKKTCYSLFTLFLVATIIACSNDSEDMKNLKTSSTIENYDSHNASQARIATSSYEQYAAILDSLYSEGYEIMENTSEIEDDGKSYLVTEVHVKQQLKGFFVEFPSEDKAVYLDRNGDYVTLYDNFNQDKPVQTFDLTEDPKYSKIGFSPYQTEGATTGRPFWGSETTTNTYYCGNGCMCTSSTTVYYVFWIAVSYQFNGTEVNC